MTIMEVFQNLANDLFQNFSITAYELLNNTRVEAKHEFLTSPELQIPNNEYGNTPASEAIWQKLTDMRILKDRAEQLLHCSPDLLSAFDRIYFDIYRNWALVQACQEYRNATDDRILNQYRREFRMWNKQLYGEPNSFTFEQLYTDKMAGIKKYKLGRGLENCNQYYEEVLQIAGETLDTGEPLYQPQTATVQRFGELLEIFFDGVVQFLPDKDLATAEDFARVINRLAEETDEDCQIPIYHAVLDDAIGSISVNHQERVMRIPSYRTFTRDRLKALVLHEYGVHMLRAIPYKTAPLTALNIALPGYEKIEEGLTSCVEQALAGCYSPSHMELYIGIGLAYFRQLNFRQVFEVLWRLHYLSKPLSVTSTHEECNHWKEQARDSAFNETQRIFRGTCKLVNCKDLMYYRGNVRLWRYIETHLDQPEQLFADLFLSGKTDILSLRQQNFVDIYRKPTYIWTAQFWQRAFN